MFCVSSGRAGMCFAPTTSHPHHRASPTSLTCPRINTATDRRPKPRAQPTLPHLLSPRYTLSPFSHSRVPIPILGSFAASARLPPRPRDPRHSPHFSFCHSNPQPCILPTPPILPLHSDLHRRLSTISLPSSLLFFLLFLPRATRHGSFSLGRLGADSANHPYWLNDPLKDRY